MPLRHGVLATVLLAAAAATAACASTPAAVNPTAASAPPAAATTAKAATPKTAKDVTDALTKALPTVTTIKIYTGADDPNHLLGRPNGYASKSAFGDSRVPASELGGADVDSVQRGGSVEVYPDADGAKKRLEYLQAIGKATSMFSEYDYLSGPVLVRVSNILPPDVAKTYEAALKTITG